MLKREIAKDKLDNHHPDWVSLTETDVTVITDDQT